MFTQPLFRPSAYRTVIAATAALTLAGCTIYPVVGAYYIEDPFAAAGEDASRESVMAPTAQDAPQEALSKQAVQDAPQDALGKQAVQLPAGGQIQTGSIGPAADGALGSAVDAPQYDYKALSEIIRSDGAIGGVQITTGSVGTTKTGLSLITGTPASAPRAPDLDTWQRRLLLDQERDLQQLDLTN